MNDRDKRTLSNGGKYEKASTSAANSALNFSRTCFSSEWKLMRERTKEIVNRKCPRSAPEFVAHRIEPFYSCRIVTQAKTDVWQLPSHKWTLISARAELITHQSGRSRERARERYRARASFPLILQDLKCEAARKVAPVELDEPCQVQQVANNEDLKGKDSSLEVGKVEEVSANEGNSSLRPREEQKMLPIEEQNPCLVEEEKDDDDEWEYYSEEEDLKKENANASLKTFGVPAGLLTRWDWTIWDESESEESEEEDEDVWSPYKKECSRGEDEHLKRQPWLEEEVRVAISEWKKELESQGWHRKWPNIERKLDEEGNLRRLSKKNSNGEEEQSWEWKEGDAILIRKTILDDNNNSEGDEKIYLYPNWHHCLRNLNDKQWRFGRILSFYSNEDQFPTLQWEQLDFWPSFAKDPSTSVCISRTPQSRDPFEHLRVIN